MKDCFLSLNYLSRFFILVILLFLMDSCLLGCTTTSLFLQCKEDELYHAGRYEDLIIHFNSTFPEQKRLRILNENKMRISSNKPTTLELIKYHFSTRYLIHSLIENGQFDKALKLCDDSIKESETLSRLFQKYRYGLRSSIELNEENQARLKLYKGYITWFRTGDYRQAFKYFSDIEMDKLSPKVRIYVLLDRGFFYEKIIGDYPKALDQFKEVIRLAGSLGLIDIDSKYAYSLQAYRRMILMNIKLGYLEQARKILDEYETFSSNLIFKIGKAALSSTQYYRGYLAMMDACAGSLFALSRDFEKSKKYSNKTWDVVKNIDEDSQHMWDQNALGTYYVLFGTYYLGLQNKYKEATEYIERGIKHLRPYYIEAIQTEIDIESAYLYLSELLYILENKHKALEQANEAIKYSNRYHNKNTAARAYTLIGQIFYDQGKIELSKDAYDKAVSLVGNIESTENWKLFFGLAHVYERNNNINDALVYFKRAVKEVEKLWDGRFTDVLKQLSFMENRLSVYDPVIRLLTSQNKAAEAMEYMEKSKSRTAYETSPYYSDESTLQQNSGLLQTSHKTSPYSKTLTTEEIKSMLPTDTILLEYCVG